MMLAPITGSIVLDDAAAIAAERNVAREAMAMKQAVEAESRGAAQAMEGNFKSALSGIKSEFGKNSALGQGLKLAAGGGAIAGIGLGAREFGELSAGIAKAANEMRSEDAHWQNVTGDFVRAIPILGDVVKGFDGLRDAITGESAALAAQDENSARSLAAWKAHEEAMAANAREAQDFNKEMRALQQTLDVIRAPQSMQGDIRDLQGTSNRRDDAQAAYEADAKHAADLEKQLQAAKSSQAAAQKARDDAHANPAISPGIPIVGTAAALMDDTVGKADRDLDKAITDTRVLQQQWSDARDKMSQAHDQLAKITAVTESIDAVNSTKQYDHLFTDLGKSFQDVAKNSEKVWHEMNAGILEDMKKAADEAKKMKEQGESITRSLRTPQEIYNDTTAELAQLRKLGDITEETLRRGDDEALRRLNDQLGNHGLSHARNEVQDIPEGHTVTVSDVIDVQRQTLDVAKQQLSTLDQVRKNTENLNEQVFEVVEIPPA